MGGEQRSLGEVKNDPGAVVSTESDDVTTGNDVTTLFDAIGGEKAAEEDEAGKESIVVGDGGGVFDDDRMRLCTLLIGDCCAVTDRAEIEVGDITRPCSTTPRPA
jgi:hypothetical protein